MPHCFKRLIASVITLSSLSACTLFETNNIPADSACIDTVNEQTAALNGVIGNLQQSLGQIEEQHQRYQQTLLQEVANLKKALASNQSKQETATDSGGEQDSANTENATPPPEQPSKLVFGATEWLTVNNLQRNYLARVDTGAAMSSLNAADMVIYEKDGEQWVKFSITDPQSGESQQEDASELANSSAEPSYQLDLPIKRFIRIRKAGIEETERRPVIELSVSVGSITQYSSFTLTDREQMTFPALLGRTFLQDIAVVDISRETIHSANQRSSNVLD